ncbi:MAG: cytochrome c [Candidatus Hydrothermarchaeaceae archaeon]
MKLLFSALLLFLVTGCVSTSGHQRDMMDQGGIMNRQATLLEEFSSNGQAIFYTGFNLKGEQISVSGGPRWLYMHGGSCVECHGVDGKEGGIPMMCSEEVPSITYHDLTEGEHEAHEGEEEHQPYTDEAIKKAITEGIEPDGEGLDPCMPKWDMSDEDLNDVIEYLKTLSPAEEGH